MVRRPLRWLLLTLALVAGGVLVAWQTLAPRGFLTVSGQVGEEAISDWAALEYGGQFDAENYIRFSGRGRLSFFGSTRRPAGSVFLSRSTGDDGVWHCGRVASATFGFRDGSVSVKDVTEILDEKTASRGGALSLSIFGGSRDECKGPSTAEGVVKGEFTPSAYSLNSEATEFERVYVSGDTRLTVFVEVGARSDGETTREVEYAWARHVTYGESVTYRTYVAGPGSRYFDEGPCPRLELVELTEPGVCAPSAAAGHLEFSW